MGTQLSDLAGVVIPTCAKLHTVDIMLFWSDENLHLWKETNNCKTKVMWESWNSPLFSSAVGYIIAIWADWKKPADAFSAVFGASRIGLCV